MRYYDSYDSWLEDEESTILVHVQSGELEWFLAGNDLSIVKAAETACALVWIDHRLQVGKLTADVWWRDGKHYGPFDVSVAISCTVDNPRQGDVA